jgi:hypothetical protein
LAHHEKIWETIYILEAEFVVVWRQDGEEKSRTVCAGDLVETERSMHTLKNETDKVARLVGIKRIPSETDYREVFEKDKVLD